jgi:hypothetical protein
MRARSLLVAATVFFAVGVAHADPKGDIEKKIKTAMESYDMMDYDAAKKQLNQALAAAKKSKLDKDAVAAKAYLDLGIVAFVNNDPDSAKLSFLSAVQIQPKIQIDAAYKSADMAKLLEEARSEAKGGGGEKAEKFEKGGGDKVAEPAASGEPAVDCTGVKGLDHTIIETAKAGAALAIEAKLGSDVKASRVSVMFRPEHATDFIEVKMSKQGDCKYTAQIPASGTKGSLVHYYVAAYGEGPKPIASKGSSGSPNIIELTGGGKGAAAKGDDEDPINGKKEAKPKETASKEEPEGGEVTATAPTGPKHPHILLAVTGGSGLGYLQGTTEALNPVKSAGVGMAGFVLMPELAYIINPKLSIGLVARLQFPVGANVDGHATLGPGGLVRLRYNLQPGDGIHVMGQLGAGIIRNTLKLDNAMPGQDTDVVAQGPLLIGGGAGYTKQLSSSVMFLADFSLLAGLAIGCTTDPMTMNCGLGSSPALNNGVTIDLSIGLALGL